MESTVRRQAGEQIFGAFSRCGWDSSTAQAWALALAVRGSNRREGRALLCGNSGPSPAKPGSVPASPSLGAGTHLARGRGGPLPAAGPTLFLLGRCLPRAGPFPHPRPSLSPTVLPTSHSFRKSKMPQSQPSYSHTCLLPVFP